LQYCSQKKARLYTNILEINQAINNIKNSCGLARAREFARIVDEAVITTDLHLDWITRRLRRVSLRHFFSIKESDISLNHCIVFEIVRKKKINIIFSFDDALKYFGIPLMPL